MSSNDINAVWKSCVNREDIAVNCGTIKLNEWMAKRDASINTLFTTSSFNLFVSAFNIARQISGFVSSSFIELIHNYGIYPISVFQIHNQELRVCRRAQCCWYYFVIICSNTFHVGLGHVNFRQLFRFLLGFSRRLSPVWMQIRDISVSLHQRKSAEVLRICVSFSIASVLTAAGIGRFIAEMPPNFGQKSHFFASTGISCMLKLPHKSHSTALFMRELPIDGWYIQFRNQNTKKTSVEHILAFYWNRITNFRY